jgi:hypothetical protein
MTRALAGLIRRVLQQTESESGVANTQRHDVNQRVPGTDQLSNWSRTEK